MVKAPTRDATRVAIQLPKEYMLEQKARWSSAPRQGAVVYSTKTRWC